MSTIAIDVGGTHTDLYGWVETQETEVQAKVPTTSDDPTRGVIEAIKQADVDMEAIDAFMHGSTIATNAIIEREYPKTPFITTEGFRDLVEIGRYHRQELYDPYQTKPDPLTKRSYRYSVPERIDEQGTVTKPLDENAVYDLATTLDERGTESVAVGFINSYANDEHEQRVKQILQNEIEEIYVSLSSDVSRKLGSIARFNTAIMNAALEPILGEYLQKLATDLADEGFSGTFYVIRSDGGVIGTKMAQENAETTILSGPAAGVKGGQIIGETADQTNVIGMDMGGTSTDVSLVEQAEPLMTTEYEVDFDIPLVHPMLDVTTIGSGGGSIAWIDQGGSLRVGPQSAGADPGPVCYDMGGTEPTITDAHLVLGRLDPESFLGGERVLNKEAARAAIEDLASELDLDPIEAAEGILQIANENMAAAVRETTIERGRDPRDYYLVGFGGCGPMHAGQVADSLGISTVILPKPSGVLSALGGTMMDIRHTNDQTYYVPVSSVDPDELNAEFEALTEEIANRFADEGIDLSDVTLERTAEMRYVGQTYEVDVPIPGGELDKDDVMGIVDQFHERHEKEYGVANPEFPVSFVNLRVAGVAQVAKETALASRSETGESSPVDHRDVYFDGEWRETAIYRQEELKSNGQLDGPAIIEGDHTTITIDPDTSATLDEHENVLLNL